MKGFFNAVSNPSTRRLIWIPIIHTQADLGSLSESVRRLYTQMLGRGKWDQHHQAIAEIWRKTRETIEGLDLPFEKVRLYQDGLPHCGREAEIVRDLAQAGSQNHQILLDLMAKGARLTGTESPQLLLEEYKLARQVLTALDSRQPGNSAQDQKEVSKVLLDKRDRHIAERIDETLQPGETGLIFLGMLHSLTGLLAADVQVTRVDPAANLAPKKTLQGKGKGRK